MPPQHESSMNVAAVHGPSRTAWGATVGTTIALQWGAVLALAGAAWLLGGNTSAVSLLCGGASVALPNALLAAWLTARMRRPGGAGPAAMLGGEMLKLGLTAALLVMAVKAGWVASWLALLVGVVGALKAQWLALWFTRKM
jgi:ATP synthase protein I